MKIHKKDAMIAARDLYQYIVVAGGKVGLGSGDKVSCVEISNCRNHQWATATDIPYVCAASRMSATICGDVLYLAGGYDEKNSVVLVWI